MSQDHPSYIIVGVGQNSENSGHRGRLVITESRVKDYQLLLM